MVKKDDKHRNNDVEINSDYLDPNRKEPKTIDNYGIKRADILSF
jgi:hypothetical protein